MRMLWAIVSVGLILCAPSASADTYVYDSLGRLTRVNYSWGGGYIEYTYDANGNRSIVTISLGPPSQPPLPGMTLSGAVMTPFTGPLIIPIP